LYCLGHHNPVSVSHPYFRPPPLPSFPAKASGPSAALPYDGDNDLEGAISQAMAAHDSAALRQLFAARRHKESRLLQPQMPSAQLTQAVSVLGLSISTVLGKRKRGAAAGDDEEDGEDVVESIKRVLKTSEACVEAAGGAMAEDDPITADDPDGVTPALLRTLNTDSVWYYTKFLENRAADPAGLGLANGKSKSGSGSQCPPDTEPRRVVELLRDLEHLERDRAISGEAHKLLKAALARGEVESVALVASIYPQHQGPGGDMLRREDSLAEDMKVRAGRPIKHGMAHLEWL
jgi:hypothetical protein